MNSKIKVPLITKKIGENFLHLLQPPIQWVTGALSLGVKLQGREDGHSPPSSAEVEECVELYLHSLNTPSLNGA
jgi:hypothetical protein